MTLSVVIPVLNEELNVRELVRRLCAALEPLGISFEIVFVNDGSTDRTGDLLRELHAQDKRVKSIHMARNFGHQAAISAGLRVSAGDAVVVMDGDLQDSPEFVEALLAKWREGWDVVYAIRVRRAGSRLKAACYRTFYRLLGAISQISIPLDSGDFSLMDRRVVDVVNSMPERTRFVRGMRSWAGFRQVGLEVPREARWAGTAKYTLGGLLRLALDGFFAFSYRPLQLASFLGLMVSGLSIVLALLLVVLKIVHGIPLLGWTSLMVAVLFLGGVQLISLGILGEYVGRIYDESRGRPPYVIAEVVGEVRGLPRARGSAPE